MWHLKALYEQTKQNRPTYREKLTAATGRGVGGWVNGEELKIEIISKRMFFVKHTMLAIWGWNPGSRDLFRESFINARKTLHISVCACSLLLCIRSALNVCLPQK